MSTIFAWCGVMIARGLSVPGLCADSKSLITYNGRDEECIMVYVVSLWDPKDMRRRYRLQKRSPEMWDIVQFDCLISL